MIEVIGVRFKDVGKIYYFDPNGETISQGAHVIVETARGIECGEVAVSNKQVEDEEIVKPLKKVVRVASEEDVKTTLENAKKAKDAMVICREKVEKHGLEMKLIDAEYTFDNSKIIFYFTADGRVDFRELVKDLASVFRTRIELRQIGVRDEAKMLGGLGVCGNPFCCSSFLGDFAPVSIKMAKDQGLSLNSSKISGTCGRLMCCLKYEQDVYEELLAITPKVGATVSANGEKGTVTEVNLITGALKVRLDRDGEGAAPKSYNRREVKIIRDGSNRVTKEELDSLRDLEG